MALLRRQTTGRETISTFPRGADGLVRQRRRGAPSLTARRVKQQRTTGGSAFYRVYETADGCQSVLWREMVHPEFAGRACSRNCAALRMAGRPPSR
jgi:hypothetical protein